MFCWTHVSTQKASEMSDCADGYIELAWKCELQYQIEWIHSLRMKGIAEEADNKERNRNKENDKGWGGMGCEEKDEDDNF